MASSNARAAVEFVPMRSAAERRSSTFCSRAECMSNTRKPKHPSTSPIPLVSMVSKSNSWRRESSRMGRIGTSALCGLRLIHDTACQGQQPRANL